VDGYDFTRERLLHSLISALELHRIAGNVRLLDASVFKQHTGGIGVLVICNGQRAEVAALLESMGVAVRPHRCGVEGHLRDGTELGPAPELPPVPVSSADSATAAEGGQPAPVKKCNRCGEVKPRSEFSSNGRNTGKIMPACKPCDRQRQRVQREARMARAASRASR
jgi:hypothetical protein